jgi:HTH-type transcriptional regulator, competence development regulator
MAEKSLAEELARLRRLKQVSLREVEKATGMSNAYLSQLEKGDAKNPSPPLLYKLAEFFEVPYESLLASAGYLDEEQLAAHGARPPSQIERMLMSARLSEEEESEVASFLEYVVSKRKK